MGAKIYNIYDICICVTLKKCYLRLELIVDTQTYHVVGARIGLYTIGSLLVVVAVNRHEVAGIQTYFLSDVPGTAQTDAITVAGERGVLLVAVGESVVGTLTTATDGKLIVDVILNTSQYSG